MRKITTILFTIFTLILFIVGWYLPLHDYITPKVGTGYALGILGAILMGIPTTLYSIRKRFRIFNWLGSQRIIFTIHMICGIFGPIAILYHSGYQLGATNSNVALYSMILVMSSGIVGRYLKIHQKYVKLFRL